MAYRCGPCEVVHNTDASPSRLARSVFERHRYADPLHRLHDTAAVVPPAFPHIASNGLIHTIHCLASERRWGMVMD
jgi:small neutral amino acid transporter SnatA (MarC family)